MSMSKEEFEKLRDWKTLHDKYTQKINEIGQRLGFDTGNLKTEIGLLDYVWRLKDFRVPNVSENIPIAAFEVICSEDQKALKGSMSNLISSKPALAVFCLIREGIRKAKWDKDPDVWLRRLENFVEKMKVEFGGIVRIAVWNDSDIDKLHEDVLSES